MRTDRRMSSIYRRQKQKKREEPSRREHSFFVEARVYAVEQDGKGNCQKDGKSVEMLRRASRGTAEMRRNSSDFKSANTSISDT